MSIKLNSEQQAIDPIFGGNARVFGKAKVYSFPEVEDTPVESIATTDGTLPRSQRLRLIVEKVSFYTTVEGICEEGVGDDSIVNRACALALHDLLVRRVVFVNATSVGGIYAGLSVQIDLH